MYMYTKSIIRDVIVFFLHATMSCTYNYLCGKTKFEQSCFWFSTLAKRMHRSQSKLCTADEVCLKLE